SDANGIVVLTQVQPISVIFTLPEDDIPLVSKANDAGKELQVDVYDRNFSAKLATGKLVAIDNQVNTSTGTFKLNSNFDNNDNALFPNQFVNVELLVDTLHDQIIIPSAAVQTGSNGAFVYLTTDNKTVSVHPIKTGVGEGDKVIATDGLAVGDKVVTEGVDKLRDGAAISAP
ncbi:MAG: efflux RND transporter periplasmic adaptor subunit, partial [Alphaproteobacteria bacterium]|nr:efflux RND transporter periplasmic adaptor subunit [Alphaproteobacteria bacterium]